MHRIINLDQVPLESYSHGDKFKVLDGPIAPLIGGKQLGYSLNVLEPGKRAWPFHCHHVNEELFVILEGHGMVRIGDAEFPIRKGDVIAAPAGGKEGAHQIVNTSNADLKYLSISTMISTDVIEYPDSNKFAVYVGGAPGEDPSKRSFNLRSRKTENLDYWDGE